MTKKQQQIYAIGALLSIVLASATYFFLVKPQMEERTESLALAEAAEGEAVTLQTALTDLQTKRDALPQTQREVDQMTEMFPTTYQQDEWLDRISSVAQSAGVRLVSITPSTPVDATQTIDPTTGLPIDPAAAAPVDPAAPPPVDPETGEPIVADNTFALAQSLVTLTASGSVTDLNAFVDGLENMERPLLIDTLGVTGTEGESEAQVSIAGKTFLSRPLADPESNDGSDDGADTATETP